MNFLSQPRILAFTDDITLIGRRDDLQLSLQIFELYCVASGAKLNLNKYTTSSFSPSNSFSQDELICGIKTVQKFVYLGIPFNANGSNKFLFGMISSTKW